MVKLLKTANPDGGPSIPVVVEIRSGSVDVTHVEITRGENEGSTRAFHAAVGFDTSTASFPTGASRTFYVEVHVLTEHWVATMQDAMTVEKEPDIAKSWDDLATTSGGDGAIHAVLVKTWFE
ncbi:hypothetical protein BWO91_19110 [Plantibacter flavus]|uniref:hypothetical protein n=1 Tax=Plantibacter flavus TaxID=150123 RepID=UPI00099DE0C5|nr:hypothetical protein [Plantibacter flavus]AQX81781.1 hypothetical protein BWO91_19110 [Plantibacter flavus]